MPLNDFIRHIKKTTPDFSLTAKKLIVFHKLLTFIPWRKGFKYSTISKETNEILGSVYNEQIEMSINTHKRSVELLDDNTEWSRKLFYYIHTCDIFKQYVNNKKIEGVFAALLSAIKSNLSYDKFWKILLKNNIISGKDNQEDDISKSIFMVYNRVRRFNLAMLADLYYFEYYCQKIKSHSLCRKYSFRTESIDKIININNDDGLPSLYFGGNFCCTGMWEPDPFKK